MTDEAVFKVRAPDGHEYSIFADGSTEGFPPGSLLFNRIPMLVAQAGDAAILQMMEDGADNTPGPFDAFIPPPVVPEEKREGMTIDG